MSKEGHTRAMTKQLTAAGIMWLVLVGSASAATITFATAPAATDTDAEPVNASASIMTGNGTVTVVLTDLEGNPISAGQLISDFMFTLSSAPSSALSTTVTPMDTSLVCIGVSPCPTTILPWGLTSSGSVVTLDKLATGPSELIIGPGPYTQANGSIDGNAAHNPFLDQTATFTFSVPGVTATTGVTAASFSFGTGGNDIVPGVPGGGGGGGGGGVVPEPASLGLVAIGGLMLLIGRMRRSRATRF